MARRARGMIPKVVHLCFGLRADFGGKPWSLVHYACVRSIVERIKPEEILFHHQYEPRGPWWELTRPLVTLRPLIAPTEIRGNALLHTAHRTDVLRLEKLIELGGIYLDCDVVVTRSFDPLLSEACVMGQEGPGGAIGLCNGVILSEAGTPFLMRWYETFSRFRSRGDDEFWNEHAVKIPGELSVAHPREITVLGPDAFHWPTWQEADLRLIYESTAPADTPNTYAHHLWESRAWERYLEGLTLSDVRRRESNFHRWVRPVLGDLGDDYGRPGVGAWVGLRLHRLGRRLARSRPATRVRRYAGAWRRAGGARGAGR